MLLILNSFYINAGQQLGQTDFERDKGDPWQICESGTGDLEFNISGGTFNITIVNPGGKANGGDDRWDCQFRHRDLTIIEGHKYEIKWSIEPSHDGFIYAKIGNQDGNIEVWHNNATNSTEAEFAATWESIPVKGGQWNEFESEFTADQTINNAEWTFHFGGAGEYQKVDSFPAGTILKFDNLSLIDTTSDENDYKENTGIPKSTIRVNQIGYFPNMDKKAILVTEEGDDTPRDFQLKNGYDVLYEGKTEPFGFDADSGEYLHIIDFSSYVPTNGDVKNVDNYSIQVDSTKSYIFAIKSNIYANDSENPRNPGNLLSDSLNYFYQARSGVDIEAKYITSSNKNELARKAGHDPDKAYVQPEWVNSYSSEAAIDKSKEIDVTGGWYDAGDWGKYIVNGGISLWTLGNLYEFSLFYPTSEDTDKEKNSENLWYKDINPVPEETANIPNILDEAKFEMDFFLKMVVTDGDLKDMVYHKIHDYTWTGLALKPANSNIARIVKPPSTAATLNFVACAAQSSRLWEQYDAEYAKTCLEKAIASYKAAKAHPNLLAPLNQAIGGGAYGDTNVNDEFYWAACELYATTGEEQYLADIKTYDKALQTVTNLSGGENTGSFSSFNWGNVASLGNLTLCLNQERIPLSKKEHETLAQSIIAAADAYIDIEKKQGYSLPYKSTSFTDENNAPGQTFNGYEWGSNSFVLNNAIVMSYAYSLTHSVGYLNGVINAMNYTLGVNGMDISYITQYGTRFAKNPHHRFWANSLDINFPVAPAGVLVGGPNSSLADPFIQSIGIPLGSPPQTCYVDNIEAWSVNECTINWNAPLAWVVGFLDTTVPNYEPNISLPVPMGPLTDDDKNSNSIIAICIIIGILLVATIAAVVMKRNKQK
ncbi:endoglucanase [Clostridia bacterium]|nr:endoglucanase [Clostridia bacterium]